MSRFRPVVTTHPTRFPLLFRPMTALRTQYTRMFPPWFWQASMKQSQPGTKTTFASHCHTLWLGCLRELLLAAAAGKPVTDFKAGDSQNSLDTMCPAPELPQDNELIFLAGITTISDEVEPEPRVEPFSVRITSKFLDFPTAHHIRHELFPVTTGTPPENFTLLTLLSLPDFRPTRLRFNLDFFLSRRFMLFGYTPTVQATLRFEMTEQEIWLSVVRERLLKKGAPIDLGLPGLTEFLGEIENLIQKN